MAPVFAKEKHRHQEKFCQDQVGFQKVGKFNSRKECAPKYALQVSRYIRSRDSSYPFEEISQN